MAWLKTNLDGVWIFEPKIWNDDRGYFVETYNALNLPEELKDINFVQDNEAGSVRGVLRGLHYQLPPFGQSKLVRVIGGEVLDVIVDLRPESSTFKQYLTIILNDITKKQLFVPKGFAHGYVVLSEEATFAYKCDMYYSPEYEAGIRYDDEDLDINWILPHDACFVSSKDKKLPYFKDHKTYKL
ncbi:MAG: dTDP-4-dehydrorhamnose 3,5-epimerase [Saprospiraceae bacterium]|jgi:dTDP-4-dehydrorhamnose 3,5-epimerase|nr:dTDP-4-dehydrorhamnose 3,5-epimerase [Saprospiraceae bacterium]MBL0027482.1 dTDP-4-dehydrorhamnose 3,5-epimerase [Saprospiraceae bacterium]